MELVRFTCGETLFGRPLRFATMAGVRCLIAAIMVFGGAAQGDMTDTQHICLRKTYDRGVGKVISACSNPEFPDKDASLCYRVCPAGYKGVGPVCWQGWKSHPRGVGRPMGCPSGTVEDAALCYHPCPAGYSPDGPVCWSTCPQSKPINGGIVCCTTRAVCFSSVIQETFGIFKGLMNTAKAAKGGLSLSTVQNTAAAAKGTLTNTIAGLQSCPVEASSSSRRRGGAY